MTNKHKIITERSSVNNIKRPILLPAGIFLALLLLIFFYTLYSQEIKNSNENMLKIIASVEQSFLRKIDQKAFYLASQTYFFNNNSCIISALSTKNKQHLKKCSNPIIEQLQDTFDLSAINYVDSEQNYLLTITTNDLQKLPIQNNKTNYFITKKAINTGQNNYGIELSYNGDLQMILSFPLIDDSKVIATIEIVTDILDIFHSLEDSYELSLFVFIEKQYMVERGIKQFYIKKNERSEHVSWDFLNHHVLLYGDESLIGEEQKNYFDQEILLNEMEQINFFKNGNFFSAGH